MVTCGWNGQITLTRGDRLSPVLELIHPYVFGWRDVLAIETP
jgi:hypothetical protein